MKLILWLMAGKALARVIGLVTALKLISTGPHDGRALASWMAARSVQTPPIVAHVPSVTKASLASPLLLTVNVVGHGPGVGVGVGDGVGVGVGVGVGGGPPGGTLAHQVPQRLLLVVGWLS